MYAEVLAHVSNFKFQVTMEGYIQTGERIYLIVILLKNNNEHATLKLPGRHSKNV